MPDIAHKTLVRNARSDTANLKPDQLLAAEVVQDVTATSDLVKVRSEDAPQGGLLYLGEASWPIPAGGLPKRGDKCLVGLDNFERPWVISWLTPAWGGSSIGIDLYSITPGEANTNAEQTAGNSQLTANLSGMEVRYQHEVKLAADIITVPAGLWAISWRAFAGKVGGAGGNARYANFECHGGDASQSLVAIEDHVYTTLTSVTHLPTESELYFTTNIFVEKEELWKSELYSFHVNVSRL